MEILRLNFSIDHDEQMGTKPNFDLMITAEYHLEGRVWVHCRLSFYLQSSSLSSTVIKAEDL